MKRAYAHDALRLAVSLIDGERERLDADAARLRKQGMKDLAAMAEKRWNVLSCETGQLRRMLAELEETGRITIEP